MDPTHDPAIAELLSFFDFAHLQERTPHLAVASAPFHLVAHLLADRCPEAGPTLDRLRASLWEGDPGREDVVAIVKLRHVQSSIAAGPSIEHEHSPALASRLRLLLEAKDCAVRAALVRHRAEPGVTMPDDEQAHVDALRGLHNAPPPRIISRHFTMTAGGPAFDPPAEPHAEVDLGAVARAAIADGDKGIAALGEAASSLGVDVGAPKMFTAAFCRWWHEQTGEHYGPGLHESAPVEMSGASRVFEAGRRSALKRERLADFVVGIDVEQGPGLAVLRGLVTELGAVADRVEAALPAEPSAVLGAGEGAQIGTTKHWLAVHEIGPDGEVDERVRIPEAWRDQARALLGQGSILVLVEATAFDPSKMRVIGE